MPRNKPLVVVTRKLPDATETRMMELFDVRLNIGDEPMSREQLAEAVKTSTVLVPTVTDTIDAGLIAEAGKKLKGKTIAEARALFDRFHRLVTDQSAPADDPALGKLNVFAGVRDYPARVKCAILAWHTLRAAVDESHEAVSTE